MDISSYTALVAGGGSGLGEAVSVHLAERGAQVIVLDKSEEQAKRVASLIHGKAIACDVSQAAALESALEPLSAWTTHQPLGIAVNCAGIAPAQRIVGKTGPMPLAAFEQVIQVNLIGSFNVMRLAAATMSQSAPNAEGERGVIINTASIAAFEGQVGQAAYSASKGGVVSMTLPAARELSRFGVRVVTVAPGLMDTPMLQGFSDEVRQGLLAQSVFPKRLGQSREFAELVAHVVANPLLNGVVIRLDGAVRLP